MERELKAPAKIGIVLIVLVALFFGYKQISKSGLLAKIVPSPVSKVDVSAFKDASGNAPEVIRIGVNTWGGYAGGQYYNEGFQANKESRFFKKCGFLVDFVVLDDFEASRSAWKSDEVRFVWGTLDSFPMESYSLSKYNPKVFAIVDWSRGGDSIVAASSIKTAKDAVGKKVAFATGTPSHTLFLSWIAASDISPNDITVVETGSAIDAAKMFAAGKVDAAVVWSPDDLDLVSKVPGAHIVLNTKTATNLIADVFYAKQEYIESHKKQLTCLMEGWLTGSAEVNSSSQSKQKAIKIVGEGLTGFEKDFIETAIDNTRLTTYGDNLDFFELNSNYAGVTAKILYTKMANLYKAIGLVKETALWADIIDTSVIESLSLSATGIHASEGKTLFKQMDNYQASKANQISEMAISVYFDIGSGVLDSTSKLIIKNKFVQTAKENAGSGIRISGNTDSTGDANANIALSKVRADAVKNYLISQGINANRIHTYGNGASKPIASNDTAEGRDQNRRTDFELIN